MDVLAFVVAVFAITLALVSLSFQLSARELGESHDDWQVHRILKLRRRLARTSLYLAAFLFLLICTYPLTAREIYSMSLREPTDPLEPSAFLSLWTCLALAATALLFHFIWTCLGLAGALCDQKGVSISETVSILFPGKR
jgi:hypothetical protein